MRIFVVIASFLFFVIQVSCEKNESASFQFKVPDYFPEMVFPEDNPLSYESWLLGKHLFYDVRLSRNNDLSCASCHNQGFGFADNKRVSLGDNLAKGTTNAPTLTNVGYNPYFLFAGGVPTLEMQILVPIQDHKEFNTNIATIINKLSEDVQYQKLAQSAYGRGMDAFVLTRAIANFLRTLISANSRYDKHFNQNRPELTESELRGYQLFFGERTNCYRCHGGFNFTTGAFENNGLYEEYVNMGRMLITHNAEDLAKFKVPTLRNIEKTAPYMHDGSLKTLEEVIEHYDSGGSNHPSKSALIRPLGLSEREKEDLRQFLLTLTDEEFLKSKFFSNPN
jgi:cytochrome c peroxidase